MGAVVAVGHHAAGNAGVGSQSAGTPTPGLLRAAALPTLATAAAVPVALHLIEGGSLDARTLQVVFIGLAALTVPHMMLIEPLRLRGWRA